MCIYIVCERELDELYGWGWEYLCGGKGEINVRIIKIVFLC